MTPTQVKIARNIEAGHAPLEGRPDGSWVKWLAESQAMIREGLAINEQWKLTPAGRAELAKHEGDA